MFTNLAIVRGPHIVVKKNHCFRWRRAWHRVGSGFGPGSSIGRHLCGQRCGASKVRAGLVLVVKLLELLDIWIYDIETFWESSEPVIFVGTGDSPRVGLDFEPKIHPIHCWDNPRGDQKSVSFGPQGKVFGVGLYPRSMNKWQGKAKQMMMNPICAPVLLTKPYEPLNKLRQ